MPFEELRASLIRYKNSDTATRIKQLQETREELELAITDAHSKHAAFATLADKATHLNYADVLRRIEKGGEYFDILNDFKGMPKTFQSENFAPLTHYFAFHPHAPQMKLLVPCTQIPLHIWKLFREAQKAHLQDSSVQFNLDELDLDTPMPEEQLYPLPIQMFGHYTNYAVDRCNMNANGEFRFAKNPHSGLYTLPGGGMLEVNLEHDLNTRIRKMLDEHLEEEHANLYQKAQAHYNNIDADVFRLVLQRTLESKKTYLHDNAYSTLYDFSQNTRLDNAGILKASVLFLDNINPQTTGIQHLRATLQVETFKLSPLYEEARQFIMHHGKVSEIEQLGDTRACGGKQISYCFLMHGEPLETWFKTKFDGIDCEMGDDMTGNMITRFTLLEALAQFDKIRFSHILIALEEQTLCLQKGTAHIDTVWNEEKFETAKTNLIAQTERFIKTLRDDVSYQIIREQRQAQEEKREEHKRKQKPDTSASSNPACRT